MKSHEALQTAIAGKTAEHAKRLHLSTISINKWQEPHTDYTDSGSFNPLDRVEAIVECALECRCDREKALMPIYWLNQRFDLISFPLAPPGEHPVNQALVDGIKEFAHLAEATAGALADNRINQAECRRIVEEGQHALKAIAMIIHAAREAAK